MIILFASFIAFAVAAALILSFMLLPSASLALSDEAAPLTREQVKALLSNVDFITELTTPLTEAEKIQADKWAEEAELNESGLFPYSLVMHEDDETVIMRHRDASEENAYLAIHSSWLTRVYFTQGCYWLAADHNYSVSVEETDRVYQAFMNSVGPAVDYWSGGNFSQVDMPSNDTTKCLTCLQHHHQVGDCFCSSKCEAAFGAPRELVMEF